MEIDDNGNGEVEIDEFIAWMGIEIETQADDDGSLDKPPTSPTLLDYQLDKVVTAVRVAMFRAGSHMWPKLFRGYDRHNRGEISPSNFRQIMRLDFHLHEDLAPDEMLNDIFSMIDEDGSGEISYDEMVGWLVGSNF